MFSREFYRTINLSINIFANNWLRETMISLFWAFVDLSISSLIYWCVTEFLLQIFHTNQNNPFVYVQRFACVNRAAEQQWLCFHKNGINQQYQNGKTKNSFVWILLVWGQFSDAIWQCVSFRLLWTHLIFCSPQSFQYQPLIESVEFHQFQYQKLVRICQPLQLRFSLYFLIRNYWWTWKHHGWYR